MIRFTSRPGHVGGLVKYSVNKVLVDMNEVLFSKSCYEISETYFTKLLLSDLQNH